MPAAHLKQEQTARVAERLLGRFTATLGLHGLDAVDEETILAHHEDHPEQLLIKLTYLTLQCQMVLLDKTMSPEQREQAVRRAFLNYILEPTDPDASSLAAYVNEVATNGQASDGNSAHAAIGPIEEVLLDSPRQQWAERWFLDSLPEENGTAPRLWSVIIASPRFEDDGWQTLRRYQAAHPDIHFELDGPFNLDSPHYAIVAGRGLGQQVANDLLQQVKEMGLPDDAYIWQAPPPADGNS